MAKQKKQKIHILFEANDASQELVVIKKILDSAFQPEYVEVPEAEEIDFTLTDGDSAVALVDLKLIARLPKLPASAEIDSRVLLFSSAKLSIPFELSDENNLPYLQRYPCVQGLGLKIY